MNQKSDRVILFDIDYTIFDTDSFKTSNLSSYKLYPDVQATLKKLTQEFRLGILSNGERELQLKKLTETNIFRLFDPELIFIFEDKMIELENVMKKLKGANLWFVEDKINMLEMAKIVNPDLKTIWYKNGPFVKLIKSDFTPDETIADFTELKSLL